MTNKNKERGTWAEQYVVNFLKDRGYQAFRIPSSGSGTKDYRPDVVAGRHMKYDEHRLIIEVKRTKNDYKYINRKSIDDLRSFAYSFNATPCICINFNKTYLWFFLQFDDDGKKNIRYDKEYGLTFDEFLRIKKEAGL
jgi:Holliday junction resolvase